MLEIGSVLDGKYKILNQISKGEVSAVYLAVDEKTNQYWAVKVIHKEGVRYHEIVKYGLVTEPNVLKKLNHPCLPRIVDVFDQEDSFVLVMDYIEGSPLAEALEEYGALPEEYVVFWVKQICDALQYLHTRQPPIILRDWSLSNIMLKPDGNISIIGFGAIEQFNKKSERILPVNMAFAAPEQYERQNQIDARTDIYNLGAIMYFLVTGHTPHPYAEPYHGMVPIREVNPSLSPELERIILKCTKMNPRDRYQSCVELLYDLEHEAPSPPHPWRRLKIFFATMVLCYVMVIIGIICWAVSDSQMADIDEPKTEEVQDETSALSNEEEETFINMDAGRSDE